MSESDLITLRAMKLRKPQMKSFYAFCKKLTLRFSIFPSSAVIAWWFAQKNNLFIKTQFTRQGPDPNSTNRKLFSPNSRANLPAARLSFRQQTNWKKSFEKDTNRNHLALRRAERERELLPRSIITEFEKIKNKFLVDVLRVWWWRLQRENRDVFEIKMHVACMHGVNEEKDWRELLGEIYTIQMLRNEGDLSSFKLLRNWHFLPRRANAASGKHFHKQSEIVKNLSRPILCAPWSSQKHSLVQRTDQMFDFF